MTGLLASMNAKVTVHPISECWNWGGAKNSRGYGSVTNGQGGTMLAHRKAYQLLVGEIPAGLTIDHLCTNKVCVNPAHLEPVTAAENMRRAAENRRASKWAWVASKPNPLPVGFADIFDGLFDFFPERT